MEAETTELAAAERARAGACAALSVSQPAAGTHMMSSAGTEKSVMVAGTPLSCRRGRKDGRTPQVGARRAAGGGRRPMDGGHSDGAVSAQCNSILLFYVQCKPGSPSCGGLPAQRVFAFFSAAALLQCPADPDLTVYFISQLPQ